MGMQVRYCMVKRNETSCGKIKILFLCWGFSIHAFRRIKLFVDDERFAVGIVSNHEYNFENADNYLLKPEYNAGKEHIGDKHAGIFSVLIRRILNKQIVKKFIAKMEYYSAVMKIQIIVLPKIILTYKDLKKIKPEIIMGINDYKILKKAVRNFKPEVIFLQTLLYPSYLAYFLPDSIPQIITFWNGDIIWWAKWNGIDKLIKKQIVTHGARRANLITVNSKMAAERCKSIYKVPNNKIVRLHYPGVDLDHFRPIDKDNAKRNLNLRSKQIILWPRGLGSYLNSDILIQSSVAVISKYPNALFLIISGVGGEEEKNKHYKLACDLGVEKHFLIQGYISYQEMPMYYGCSDAVVSISSNDSLPNVMIEAMACGVPLVMGDIPQIRDWITDGYNGYLVPLRDPEVLSKMLIRLLDNPDGNNEVFIKRNIELVKKEFDSKKNIETIKTTVIKMLENYYYNQ